LKKTDKLKVGKNK